MSNLRKQANVSLGGISDLVRMKALSEEKKAIALEARLNLEREKLELDKAKSKVEMACKVFSTEGVDADVKSAANAYLKSLFS